MSAGGGPRQGSARIGGEAVATAFAVPSGRADTVLGQLDDAGLGAGRARIAAGLGDPDPFALRAVLAAHPSATVEGCGGRPLSADAATAALVRAAIARGDDAPGLAGLFAFQPPGPQARAVPVGSGAGPAALRWRRTFPSPPRVGAFDSWTMESIGDAATATARILCTMPGGVAIGSDYGLTLWSRAGFRPFPWPRGARREARRVEALAATAGALYVGTSQTLYTWDHRGEPKAQKYGADQEGGYDDLLALYATESRLLSGYRTRLDGGAGPADTLCFAADPTGVVYAGTRAGEVHVVDGGGPIRTFGDDKPRPVRHLAWADGALFVAAAGGLHRFDGAGWATVGPEPGALATDSSGRLWAIVEGGLAVWWEGALHPVPVPLDRPWSLAATPDALWIGGVGAVGRLGLR